jgi:hypothetical protein
MTGPLTESKLNSLRQGVQFHLNSNGLCIESLSQDWQGSKAQLGPAKASMPLTIPVSGLASSLQHCQCLGHAPAETAHSVLTALTVQSSLLK